MTSYAMFALNVLRPIFLVYKIDLMNVTSSKSRSRGPLLPFCLGLAVALGVLYALHAHLVAASCSSDVRRIGSPAGMDYATVEHTACDNLGGSEVVTVSVHTNSGASPIFIFDPSSFSGPVQVTWANPHTLVVGVERVQQIQKQVNDANGVSIHYHVGAIGEPVERQRLTR